MYALVDCNNFYVSCERVFNPLINNKPVVVLSNNDGCIIARSNEAKALGIPMGAPLHLWKDLIKKNRVIVYSSNYTLYGDMSSRVMNSFYHFTPDVEVYSIDEAFLGLDGFNKSNIYKKMIFMKKKIYQWTGIPVSVGIGPTKTLAKLANRIAKKYVNEGVYNLQDSNQITQVLNDLELETIWGISKGWANRLKKIGINNALQLQRANPNHIKQHISVVGKRIVYELRGISALDLEEVNSKKSITVSRSFGETVTDLQSLKEALSNHIFRAAEKLRLQRGLCSSLCVFINTNKFKKSESQYSNSGVINFDEPINNTPDLIQGGFRILEKIYRLGFSYKKIGVTLLDLNIKSVEINLNETSSFYKSEDYTIRGSLFNKNKKDDILSNKRMIMLDYINNKMGSKTLFYGSQGLLKSKKNKSKWNMKSHFKSKSYTTNWNQLLIVK